MAYRYARKITVTNEPEAKPDGFSWVKNRPQYQVRSDMGNLNTRMEDCATLTEARIVARSRAKSCGWAEIFRWAETGVSLRKFFVASYEREIQA